MRPVWSFTLERTTNAPLELVTNRLMDGQGFHAWHPRHTAAVLEVIREDALGLELVHDSIPFWGIVEQDRYLVTRQGEGLLLSYTAHFKGWPVLLMMSWWRIVSDRLWERFVEHLS